MRVALSLVVLAALGCQRAPEGGAPPTAASSSAPPPSAAASAPAVPRARFGALMLEVGTRFERAGRAGVAGQWALGQHQMEELTLIFTEDAPHARQPDGCPVDLAPLSRAFARDELPRLKRALAAHDAEGVRKAYAETAAACNGCHENVGFEFVVVPGTVGESSPVIGPGAASAGGHAHHAAPAPASTSAAPAASAPRLDAPFSTR